MLLGPREVYLDHNATTPVEKGVQRAMEKALASSFGNPSSLHTHGRRARGLVEHARAEIAKLLRCRVDQIVFTSGGTEGNNAVLKGVFLASRERYGKSGHVITSKIEHDSVLGACKQIEALGGRVTYLPAGRDGLVRVQDVKEALEKNADDTVLVSIMHANNETGAIQPIREIGALCKAARVPFHTDAVQSFGKIPTHVDELGCDFLTLTAHKIYGPKGAGALFIRGNAPFFALQSGGDQEGGLRTGTEGVHQIVGLGVAAALAEEHRESEFFRMRELREEFLGLLREAVPNVIVHEAPQNAQLPATLSLAFPGIEGLQLLAGLDCWEVSVSIGSACTADRIEPSHVMLGMGIDEREALSTIRVSMGRGTSRRDMRYVAEVIGKITEEPPNTLRYLDPQHLDEARIRSPQTFLIDLRMPHERFLDPTIPGAVEWSALTLDKSLSDVPRDKEAILMCGTGIISYAAGYRLANAGHPNVRVVYGGYAAWHGRYPTLLGKLIGNKPSSPQSS